MALWRHLVALWVVVHVASTCVSAIPDPRFAMKKEVWKDARVQSEMDVWAAKLGVERKGFEEDLWRLGEWAVDAHTLIDVPFAPYVFLSANRQRWPMFGAGSPEADRYEVRGRSCTETDEARCPWERLYRTGDADARLLARVIEAPRVRSLVSTASYRGHGAVRRRACSAIAHDVFALRPDLQEVDCAFLRQHAPRPRADAKPAVLGARERVVSFSRASLAASMAKHADEP